VLTIRELAERAGVAVSTVTLAEGDGNPRLESLIKIAEALDAEVVLRSALPE
jgi:transcriptional regulator with XRE-family HTH domain